MKKIILFLLLINSFKISLANYNVEYQEIKKTKFKYDETVLISCKSNFDIDTCRQIKEFLDKYSKVENKIMISIYIVESKFNQYANSYLGAKYGRGIGQVSEIALDEYNRKNKTNYKYNDLYDLEINIMISCWLIDYYCNTYNFTIEESVMAYNIGCGNVLNGKKAERYLILVKNEYRKMMD